MEYACLPFEATHAFSSIFLDYITQKPALRDFYNLAPTIENFRQVLENKQFDTEKRQNLVNELKKQYANVGITPSQPIEMLLQPNTFTVTTGHQLCLYTGPMYFVYKILTTIRLAEELKKKYPTYNFVPIFWLASEDHDFEEINHFHLFGQKITWESTQKGAVGRFKTDELAEVFAQMQERLPDWETLYLTSKNLSEATIQLVHTLFGKYGLLTLDADNEALKRSLGEVIKRDIFEQASFKAVSQTNEQLIKAGYKPQVNPREINFFYLLDGFRERIAAQEGGFKTAQGEYTFSNQTLQIEAIEYPERFSPNVLLRPIYQEMILPNLAYIGGPGELAYWLQFKTLFETYNLQMPILFPRNFGLIIQKTVGKKIAKLGLSLEELFLPEAEQKAKIIAQTTGEAISLDVQRNEIEKTFQTIVQEAEHWDKTLVASIDAEKHKALKSLENLEKRLRKAQEIKADTELKQLASVRDKIFPQGNLQERHDNYLNFSLNNSTVLDTIYQTIEPFNYQLYLWQEAQ
jgi:bacillithiol biosynthesis cysteine-adding enzyme BshC